ncbi:MAG TPA: VOC family protein [Candidatus Binatia bacterium]|nr:VOC family protein [Candidatus Binatia bacterium]
MLVQSLDHFVVPVNDIVVAEDFYAQVFGGKILKRNGLNVKTQALGPHTFMDIAGKRIGVYLQKEERGQPITPRGIPTYSFTTTKHGIEEVMDALERWKIAFEGPQKHSHPFATTTLFFADPAGNNFAVYVPSIDGQGTPASAGRLTGVGYLELEAPKLDESIKFYQAVLAFELLSRGQDAKNKSNQAAMRMASGQHLILTEAPFGPKGYPMSRKIPGPHLGFYVAPQQWRDALAQLDRLGIPNGDRGEEAKGRHPGGTAGTYMDDPAGYVIQYITEGMQ